jgi:hypothetical protein
MLRILGFFFCGILSGQIQEAQTWDATEINSIHLNFPWASSISVSTHKHSSIKVKYQKEGEYQNLYLIRSNIKGAGFYLDEFEMPNSEKPGDKLSAHKVVANQIELEIPESMLLNLVAKEAKIKCSGIFELLNINIDHGSAVFNISNPSGEIKSLSADLHFFDLYDSKIPEKLNVKTAIGNILVHPN